MVAIYYFRAVIAVLCFGLVHYVGTIILFGPGGLANIFETPAAFTEQDKFIRLFWAKILPIIFLISISLYLVLSSQIRERE